MAFDLERMADFAQRNIAYIARKNPGKTFYAFAIDANLLCLNDLDSLERDLSRFGYRSDLEEFKYSVGDWKFQGFAEMASEDGFDLAAYEKHYDLLQAADSNADRTGHTAYAQAMDALIDRLNVLGAFLPLKRTIDFRAFRSYPNY